MIDLESRTLWQQAPDDTDQNYTNMDFRWGVILNEPGYAGSYPDCRGAMHSDGVSSRKLADLRRLDIPLDIHHIFPKDWCKKQGIPPKVYDSIINKTPISYKANRKIGGAAPAAYLEKIQGDRQVQSTDEQMNEVLATHFIDPASMRANDFDEFWFTRKKNLVRLIDKAMGKSTSRDHDWANQVQQPFQDLAQTIIRNRLPAPIVGLDLADEQGEVLVTAEMAWQQDKVAIVDDDQKMTIPNWSLFGRSQLFNNLELLSAALSEPDSESLDSEIS